MCDSLLNPSHRIGSLMQVYVEDGAFVEALCRAAISQNKSTPTSVHITVSTGAVSAL